MFAQSIPPDLTVRNRAGMTLSPLGNLSRPVLALTLPGQTTGHAAVLELPEHAWGHPRGQPDQQVFYNLYSAEPKYRPETNWAKSGSALRFQMVLLAGLRIAGEARLDDDGVDISYELQNLTAVDFDEAQAVTCVRLYPPFTDVFLERTWMHHAAGLALVGSETPERLTMNAEEWLPCRYIVRCAPTPPVALDKRVEKTPDRVTRYTKLQLADIPFLATESSPAGWVAATHAVKAPSVFTNPARTCHHADPYTALPPQGTGKLALKFYLMRGTVNDGWTRVSKRHAAGIA